ncbi:MAG TPA: glycosyltransferase family A protein [Bryobacteraceae bacterium]|nr:glycosyltransferase family A protein [Bryobacteraceae bacterium]
MPANKSVAPGGPAVSVIIATYNRGEILCQTMAMALAQDYTDFEVIVVDQSPEPPEAVQRFVQNAGSRLKYIRRETPNLPAARNAGVRAAQGEIVVFIDDDVVIEPDFAASHLRHYSDDQVGCVTGPALPPDERSEQEVLAQQLRLFNVTKNLDDGCCLVEWGAGCNFSFRKTAFLKAGMSDVRFSGGWAEDADLCVRIRHQGYVIVFDPRVRLIHLALRSGGCAFRESSDEERRRAEQCRMYLFLNVKNWTAIGTPMVMRNLWFAYRNYALNRDLLRAPARLLFRQGRFMLNLMKSARMCFDSPLSAHE